MTFNQFVWWLAQAIVALFLLRLIFRAFRWVRAKRESRRWNEVLSNSALTEDVPMASLVSPESRVFVILIGESVDATVAGFLAKKCNECGESHAMVFESGDDALDFAKQLDPAYHPRVVVTGVKMSDIWFNRIRIMFAGSSKHLDVLISNWNGDWDGSCARVDQQCA